MDERDVARRAAAANSCGVHDEALLGAVGTWRPLPPQAPCLGGVLAGAMRGGVAEPARGGEWRWARAPVRDARSRAGVCWRRESPGP
eukprot:2475336-Alexandrium_andersonii.AAC.1